MLQYVLLGPGRRVCLVSHYSPSTPCCQMLARCCQIGKQTQCSAAMVRQVNVLDQMRSLILPDLVRLEESSVAAAVLKEGLDFNLKDRRRPCILLNR